MLSRLPISYFLAFCDIFTITNFLNIRLMEGGGQSVPPPTLNSPLVKTRKWYEGLHPSYRVQIIIVYGLCNGIDNKCMI